MREYFVAGTDTGVGKTTVAAALLLAARRRGLTAAALKPVETGCPRGDDGALVPQDATLLHHAAGAEGPVARTCPFTFELPAAPAVAARAEEGEISLAAIAEAFARNRERSPDLALVEGAGGLLVPFTDGATAADVAAHLAIPLLVVARDGLGTINHTALTVECARNRDLEVSGVVLCGAERGTSLAAVESNAHEITRLCEVPVLGYLPHLPDRAPSTLANAAELGLALDALL